ncbi:hypothetical protein AOA80_07155 [Methanomassiliicoccales archaeon RumEn M1]|jgi:hypothetical protein|nr:hypothetical protein AOA80_07155 [Methanomassiliicoccales archaeon RumEn M1]
MSSDDHAVNTSPAGRIGDFYRKYLPIGDRIGEMFYATWMVVVSLGIINSVEGQEEVIPLAIAIAFGVNIIWGIIDGTSVMLTGVIDRARRDQILFDLRTVGDPQTRQEAKGALDDTIASALSDEEKERIIDLLAEGEPQGNPYIDPYHPSREDWYYVLGILAIDTFFVIPIIVPLLMVPDIADAILLSRMIATLIFAALGTAYAKRLNRSRLLAALFLGTLGFSVFSISYVLGW